MPVAFHLETKMKAFRDSIPLLLDLKNEALRERFALIYFNPFSIYRKILLVLLGLLISVTGVMPCPAA